jgi:hypothetical protein
MVTRRNLLKRGGAAMAGLTVAPRLSPIDGPRSEDSSVGPVLASVVEPRHRQGGAGPLYWSPYAYNNETNMAMPEDLWKTNVDWVADTFLPYGYDMVCTDGWVDYTQKVTAHGYIRSFNDSWTHDWAWWVAYVRSRGLQLGVYYNPLWVTKSAVQDRSITVVGRPDIAVADLVNEDDYLNSDGQLYWVDVTRDGAEEYVKGYVEYFRALGAVFLRIDFLAWYETGFDQTDGTIGVAHGSDNYSVALRWMNKAAGEMKLSLVMPNLFGHGATERRFGDLIRIDDDVSYGGWFFLNEGRQTWQPMWTQWRSAFLGFTGFSDISGRGQLTLDGDPLIMSSFGNDDERQSAINLFVMAGAAIAITDQQDTIGANAPFFQNRELLALHHDGLVGKPVYANTHSYFYDTTSRDPERWIGQLSDGSWVVGLFNRSNEPGTVTKTIDFAKELGLRAPAHVRDVWAHADLGLMTSWSVALPPHASSLIKVTTQDEAHYEAEVGAWSGSARFDNAFGGFEGLGYVTGLDQAGSAVALAVAVPDAGSYHVDCHVANACGGPATLRVISSDPASGRHHGTGQLVVPTAKHWTTWRTATATLELASGVNLVTLGHTVHDRGSVNVDHMRIRPV